MRMHHGADVGAHLIDRQMHGDLGGAFFPALDFGALHVDHNQVVAKDKLAIRVASVYDKGYYKVEPAFTVSPGLAS